MAADGHLGYTKMAITSQPVCRSTRYLVGWVFGPAELMVQLSNFKNSRWRYTRTAVARNPCVSWAFLLLNRQPHGVECQSLCGSGVTCKIKQLEIEEEHVPQCPIAGDAKVCVCLLEIRRFLYTISFKQSRTIC